jgi:glycosyltransferase involved in cell wall biosynthesis
VRLTALVEHPEHVCARYRLAAFRPFLDRAGHSLELRPWPKHWWSWLALPAALRHADAVIVQRRLLPSWQLSLVRRGARRLVFDFDDAVFLRDSYARRGLHSVRRLLRFQRTVAAADAVVAGNPFLQAQARRWTAPDKVRVVPTCVDPARYSLAEHRRKLTGGAQLVWIGSASTLRGLVAIQPLLEELGQRMHGLQLKLICDRFLDLSHVPVQRRIWSEGAEAEELAEADIGISYIPDDLWSLGKCGLKVLQYMAAGLPVVANPVGVQADIVLHGETGYLVETPEEWLEAVARLGDDPALRQRMGRAGRRLVECDYGVAVGGAAWVEILRGMELHDRAA